MSSASSAEGGYGTAIRTAVLVIMLLSYSGEAEGGPLAGAAEGALCPPAGTAAIGDAVRGEPRAEPRVELVSRRGPQPGAGCASGGCGLSARGQQLVEPDREHECGVVADGPTGRHHPGHAGLHERPRKTDHLVEPRYVGHG